jgi:hypothetical protein
LAVIRDCAVIAAESPIDALKFEPSTRLQMSVVEVVTLKNPNILWRDLLETLINQTGRVSDTEQQISGEDVIKTFLLPCPRLFDIIDLEVTIR